MPPGPWLLIVEGGYFDGKRFTLPQANPNLSVQMIHGGMKMMHVVQNIDHQARTVTMGPA